MKFFQVVLGAATSLVLIYTSISLKESTRMNAFQLNILIYISMYLGSLKDVNVKRIKTVEFLDKDYVVIERLVL